MTALNLFLDKNVPPTPARIAQALGARAKYLAEFKHAISAPYREEWKHYGKTIGWTLKLLVGKRNLCFIVVRDGYFTVAFVFGDKAVAAVEQGRLARDVVQTLVNARRYAEGRGIRLEVKSRQVLAQAITLLGVKEQGP